jgi:HlyD family secretion protein
MSVGCQGRNSSSGSEPAAHDPNRPRSASAKVVALGRLEPADGVITISALPGERIETVTVKEGDAVSAGMVLADLSSYRARSAEVRALENRLAIAPQRWQSQISVAEARIAQAEAALEQAKAKQQEVDLQQSSLPLLARHANRAEVTYHKLTDMAEDDAALATQRELERYELARDKAGIDLDQAKKRYELAKIMASKTVEAAQADVVTARKTLEELKLADPQPELADQLELARIQREMSRLRAPIDGKVLKVYLQEGEIVTDRPVMQMANLDHMICIAEVYEADAKKIRAEQVAHSDSGTTTPGDRVLILSKAFDNEFDDGIPGIVEHVGSMVAPPGLQSRNPLAPADRSVVLVSLQVKVEFRDREEADK